MNDSEPGPQEKPVLNDLEITHARILWRKYEGSKTHPGSEHARWINERNMWVWFSRYGGQLLERLK